jgi:hypothetical protein
MMKFDVLFGKRFSALRAIPADCHTLKLLAKLPAGKQSIQVFLLLGHPYFERVHDDDPRSVLFGESEIRQLFRPGILLQEPLQRPASIFQDILYHVLKELHATRIEIKVQTLALPLSIPDGNRK